MPHTSTINSIEGNIGNNILELGVRLDVQDVNNWIRAMVKVEYKAKTLIEDEVQKECASDLQQQIYVAIKTGRIPETPPYVPKYKKWKNKFYAGKPVWELKGDLAGNLRAFSVPKLGGSGRDWVAGVPDGVMDSGGKSLNATGSGKRKEIAYYGAINEAVRPLFKPITNEYASSGWTQKVRTALSTIGREWR